MTQPISLIAEVQAPAAGTGTNRNTNVSSILFPVEEHDVYFEIGGANGSSRKYRVPDHRVIINAATNEPLAVVSGNYRLVTNEEALELAKECFTLLFGAETAYKIIVFNIIAPSTGSFCHVDLIHENYTVNVLKRDTWLPYLRVTNSYNHTRALRFDLGFCRKLCLNGVIFERETIAYKFPHTRKRIGPRGEFKVNIGTLKRVETRFCEYMQTLQDIPVPEEFVFPIVCKALGISFDLKCKDEKRRKRESDRYEEFLLVVEKRTRRYCEELGANAYAVLNVISDIASNPSTSKVPSLLTNTLQRRTGKWIESFIDEIHIKGLSIEEYIDED